MADGMPVALETRFPVSRVAEALAALRRPGRRGRITVQVEGGWGDHGDGVV